MLIPILAQQQCRETGYEITKMPSR